MSEMLHVEPEIKGLLFDCDGTLVDSMPLHMKAWEKAFHLNGYDYDHALLYSLKGMKETDVIRSYNQHYGRSLDPEEMVRIKHELLSEELEHVKPIPLVVNIVHAYYGKMPLAVVSGSPRHVVYPELKAIGVFDMFETILTADDPFKPKPAPDIFLEAARRINVKPHLCQVFEDGDPGLESARNAGMWATDIRPYLGT